MHMFVLCNCWCVLKVDKFGIEVLLRILLLFTIIII